MRPISAVAEASLKMQAVEIEGYSAKQTPSMGHVVSSHYDATPMLLSFAQPALKEKLEPLARYYVKAPT